MSVTSTISTITSTPFHHTGIMAPNHSLRKKAYVRLSARPKSLLLTLPGEIRNHIYDFVFDSVTSVDFMPSPAAQYLLARGIRTPPNTPVLRHNGPLGKYVRIKGLDTKWKRSLSGLVLANKQIHKETKAYLYNSCNFYFQSSNSLNNFLTAVPQTSLKAVTRLSLVHVTCGEPYLVRHKIWKAEQDANWLRTWQKAASRLPNLQSLDITIKVRERPLRFAMDEPWVQRMLDFKRLPLRDVRITITSSQFPVPWFKKVPPTPVPLGSTFYILLQNGTGHTFQARDWEETGSMLHDLFGRVVAAEVMRSSHDDCTASDDNCKAWQRYRDAVIKHKKYSKHMEFCRNIFGQS